MKCLFYIYFIVFPLALFSQVEMIRIGNYKGAMPKDENYILREVDFSDFKDFEGFFENFEATNLQKSLFYQGFYPELFANDDFRLEMDYSTNFNQFIYDEYLGKDRHIKDAKKAFAFAFLDYNKAFHEKSSMAKSNLANLYLTGLGTEKNIEKALEVLAENPLFKMSIADILNKTGNLGRCDSGSAAIIAYLYYYGVGVEKNIEKSNAILEMHNAKISWRNFYAGYLVPKDFDFAIYCLEQSEEFWASEVLVNIYKGKYAKNDIDETKASFWEGVSQERFLEFRLEQKKFFANFITNSELKGDILGLSFLYGFEKVYLKKMWRHDEIEFENPFYDLEKSQKYLSDFKDKYKGNTRLASKILQIKLNATLPCPTGTYYRYEGEIFKVYKSLLTKNQDR